MDGSSLERWVSVDEAAAHLGVRKDSIYRWIEARGLPAQKIGKLWKLRLSAVDAWVKAGGTAIPDEPSPAPESPANVVLIVDDDEGIRETLQDVLTDAGYQALSARDGVEALALLRSPAQPRPSLILLDLRMPHMDGIQFLQEQSRDPQLAGIPVIAMTAERRAHLSGTPILGKPIDVSKLLDAIRGAVR